METHTYSLKKSVEIVGKEECLSLSLSLPTY